MGAKGKNEGVLLLLVIGDRRSRLEVGYGLEPIIPDGFAGQHAAPDAAGAAPRSDTARPWPVAAQTIGSKVAEAKGVQIGSPELVTQRRPRSTPSIPWPLLLGGRGVVLFWLLRRGGGRGGGSGGLLHGIDPGQPDGARDGRRAAAADSADTIPAAASADLAEATRAAAALRQRYW